MENLFEQLIRETEAELGRHLYREEIAFLKWVDDRHQKVCKRNAQCV